MNLVSECLTPEAVLAGVNIGSKKQLLEAIGDLLSATGGLASRDVFDSLFAREKLGSTALGYGIAIPHGRIKGLKSTTCAFLRLAEPVDYDAPDGMPVDLVFALLVPTVATDLHLQILAELAQLFSSKDMRERLRASEDAAALCCLIREWTP
jgi:PTS system nitrogen regulatory IIA component